jgi:hypothetical protein
MESGMEEIAASLARQFGRDSQSVRMKKLLLYACYGQWENSLERLQKVNLEPVILQLRDGYASFQQLQAHLQATVNHLSKPAEYSQVADALLANLSDLYPETQVGSGEEEEEPTAFVGSFNPGIFVSGGNPLFMRQTQIAQSLDLHPDRDRIAKLLICITRQHWEADPLALAKADIRELVDEVWRLCSTLDDVQQAMVTVIQRISKRGEYAALAKMILQQLKPLYEYIASSLQEPTTEGIIASLPPMFPPVPVVLQRFDSRLEIIKFCNPLRAKILLFSLLHHALPLGEPAPSMLRSHTLEDLLEDLVAAYDATEISDQLHKVAQHLPESDDYKAVVAAILKALKIKIVSAPISAGDRLPATV